MIYHIMLNLRFGCLPTIAVSSHLRYKCVLPCRDTCHPLSHVQRRGVYTSILISAISSQLDKNPDHSSTSLMGGVELSESLTFSVHIANIVSSACQKLGFLRRNLKRCPRDIVCPCSLQIRVFLGNLGSTPGG